LSLPSSSPCNPHAHNHKHLFSSPPAGNSNSSGYGYDNDNDNEGEVEVEDEEEEGTGGADSISNILTIEERKVLSPQQRAAWRALQADMSTRRQGEME
jgi:hypothetical protein